MKKQAIAYKRERERERGESLFSSPCTVSETYPDMAPITK